MKKYEYKRVVCRYTENEIDVLNALGQHGWQLVNVIEFGIDKANRYFYMMREI